MMKREVIEGLSYTSVCRVFLQSRKRYWLEDGVTGEADVDLPIMRVLEQPLSQKKDAGILEAFISGEQARKVCALNESERIEFAIRGIEQVHPGILENVELGVTKCWDEDKWAKGAYCWFKPGELTSWMQTIILPEGRIHFAGEHTSKLPATMEGALESGVRAAREIIALP